MTESTETKSCTEPRRRPRVGVAAGALACLDLLVVALLMLLDKAQVQTQQELGQVAFGTPLNWVTQDQALDPPLPYSANFASPWENPTTIDWLQLVLNVVMIGLVLLITWRGVLMLRSTRSAK